MADNTSDGTPPTSSSPPPPARRTRRASAVPTAPTAKRKPGPKPGSKRQPRLDATAAAVVTEAVAPKYRKVARAVKDGAEKVGRKAPQAKARATRVVKKATAKVDKATASPLRNGILLGAAAAIASVVAGVFALGRAKKPEAKHVAKPDEPKPTTSAD